MAEGSLAANGTATVTLDDRVAQVIVTAVGGELWVTTDGSNPDHPKANTVRVIPSRSPQSITVSSRNEPTVVKLRSPKGADYTVVAGTQTDVDSAPGMGAGAQSDVVVPAPETGDAGKVITVNEAGDGYELAQIGALVAADMDAHETDTTAHTTVAANRQTASYGLVLADAGKVVEMNVASANNLTVPLNATQAFPVGTVVELLQYGAGQSTVVATAGVTIRSSGGKLKLTGQYSGASLRKIATDEWSLVGDLSA